MKHNNGKYFKDGEHMSIIFGTKFSKYKTEWEKIKYLFQI